MAIDGATNRIATAGYLYDANGNMTQMPQLTMRYDVANRMVTSNHAGVGTQSYGYNQANQRVFVRTGATVTYYLYGMGGERLMEFQETCTGGGCAGYVETQRWIYFAGRKLFSKTGTTLKAVTPDRLASEAKHSPYGETDGAPPSDTKDYFATYRRDGTGLDYAWNRYYSPTMGRFTTADPYGGSVNPGNPGSWNRYGYAEGDPVNGVDPSGLMISILKDDSGLIPVVAPRRYDYFPVDVLVASLFQRSARASGIRRTQFEIWEDMFDNAAAAFVIYAATFATRLRTSEIPEECSKDIDALEITANAWADVLENLSIHNGIGSKEPYYTALPVGSPERRVAQERNLTVGSNFGRGSGVVAVSSVNDNRVWIDPRRVKPEEVTVSSALLAHEALHKFGFIDTEIQQKLNIEVGAPSVHISNKLAKDCFSIPSSRVIGPQRYRRGGCW